MGSVALVGSVRLVASGGVGEVGEISGWVEVFVTVPGVLLLLWKISGVLTFFLCVATDTSNVVSALSRGTTTSE